MKAKELKLGKVGKSMQGKSEKIGNKLILKNKDGSIKAVWKI